MAKKFPVGEGEKKLVFSQCDDRPDAVFEKKLEVVFKRPHESRMCHPEELSVASFGTY